MRKIYLDNIRWATVLLVLVYHVCYLFNGVGVLGGIPDAANIPAFDWFACMVYPWFMVLLFVIAGMSARYALQKRTARQFLRERTVKLLIPSTLGLFVLHWITGYLNIKIGGGLAYIPPALLYPIAAISGTGPLWFIQMLFVFSCVLVLLHKTDRAGKLWTLCGKANFWIVFLLFLPIWGAAHLLNLPVLTMYRFGIYFVAFLIGYYVFSHEEVQEAIERMRVPTLCLSVIAAVLYGLRYGGSDYTSSDCLQNIITNFYLWMVVLAALGWGRVCFNRETAFTAYMTKASFGLYVLHYPVLMGTGCLLHSYFELPAIWNYGITLAAEIVLTLTAYEIIKRVPILRFLVLGLKKSPRKGTSRTDAV